MQNHAAGEHVKENKLINRSAMSKMINDTITWQEPVVMKDFAEGVGSDEGEELSGWTGHEVGVLGGLRGWVGWADYGDRFLARGILISKDSAGRFRGNCRLWSTGSPGLRRRSLRGC